MSGFDSNLDGCPQSDLTEVHGRYTDDGDIGNWGVHSPFQTGKLSFPMIGLLVLYLGSMIASFDFMPGSGELSLLLMSWLVITLVVMLLFTVLWAFVGRTLIKPPAGKDNVFLMFAFLFLHLDIVVGLLVFIHAIASFIAGA